MTEKPVFTWDDVSNLYAVATLCRKGSPLAHRAGEIDDLANRIAAQLEEPKWDGEPIIARASEAP